MSRGGRRGASRRATQELEGHPTPEREILSEPDHTHPAAGQTRDQAIVADGVVGIHSKGGGIIRATGPDLSSPID